MSVRDPVTLLNEAVAALAAPLPLRARLRAAVAALVPGWADAGGVALADGQWVGSGDWTPAETVLAAARATTGPTVLADRTVVAPLPEGGAAIGWLVLVRGDGRPLGPGDLAVVRAFADRIAMAMHAEGLEGRWTTGAARHERTSAPRATGYAAVNDALGRLLGPGAQPPTGPDVGHDAFGAGAVPVAADAVAGVLDRCVAAGMQPLVALFEAAAPQDGGRMLRARILAASRAELRPPDLLAWPSPSVALCVLAAPSLAVAQERFDRFAEAVAAPPRPAAAIGLAEHAGGDDAASLLARARRHLERARRIP